MFEWECFSIEKGGTKGEIWRNEEMRVDRWREVLQLEFPVHKTKGNFTKQECMYNAI